MKLQSLAFALVTATATVGLALGVKADITEARCDIYPSGEDQATSYGPCTFSQRQGYVTITLKDGTTYELSPSSTQAATYTDQNGRSATREDGLGEAGLVYRLADVSIFVYWGVDAVPDEPRRGEGNVPCSVGQPAYDQMCRAMAVYGDPGNSTLTLVGPTGNEHNLSYYDHAIHSPDPSEELLVQYLNGQYLLNINDSEFFKLDETIVTGVD